MALPNYITRRNRLLALGAILLMGTYGFGAISISFALGGVLTLGLGAIFLQKLNSPAPRYQKKSNDVPARFKPESKKTKTVGRQIEGEVHVPHTQAARKRPERLIDEPVLRFDNFKELQKLAQTPGRDLLTRFMTTFHHIFASCLTKENKEIFGNEFNNYFRLDGEELLQIFDGIESTRWYQANQFMLNNSILKKINKMLESYKANPLSVKTNNLNANSACVELTSKITEYLGPTIANMLFFEQGKRIHACATLEDKIAEMVNFAYVIISANDVQEIIAGLPKPSLDVLKHKIVQQQGGDHVKEWIEAAKRKENWQVKRKNRP